MVQVKEVSKVASEASLSAAGRVTDDLLRLEKQNSAVTEVEVDEVLRLCDGISIGFASRGIRARVPCVTKLPKFLPTMQCHVAPFLSSNWLLLVRVTSLEYSIRTDRALDVMSDLLKMR